MSYEEHIATLFDAYGSAQSEDYNLRKLLCALGCRNVDGMLGDNPRLIYPPEPGAEHEQLVSDTLRQVLRMTDRVYRTAPENCFALLDGLTKNDRWQRCLQDADTAHKFSTMLVDYFDSIPNSHEGRRLRAEVSPDICAMLNEWLKPAILFQGPPDPEGPADDEPTMVSLVSAMFGEPWCAITLDEGHDQSWEMPDLVREHRPDLQPHLTPDIANPMAESLPTLEAS